MSARAIKGLKGRPSLDERQLELLRSFGLPEDLTTLTEDQWVDVEELMLSEVLRKGFTKSYEENEYGLLCSSIYMAMTDVE